VTRHVLAVRKDHPQAQDPKKSDPASPELKKHNSASAVLAIVARSAGFISLATIAQPWPYLQSGSVSSADGKKNPSRPCVRLPLIPHASYRLLMPRRS
jgi:hypothetical protein